MQKQKRSNILDQSLDRFSVYCSFKYIDSLFHTLTDVTNRLQGSTIDIVNASNENVETIFLTIYLQATCLAARLLVEATMPRNE